MKPEQAFWAAVKKHLPGFNQRIENAAGTGTPDVYSCWGKPFWIELKVYPNDLSAIQEVWHWQNCDNGGVSFVLTKVGKSTAHKAHILLQKATIDNDRLTLKSLGIFQPPVNYNLLVNTIKGALNG